MVEVIAFEAGTLALKLKITLKSISVINVSVSTLKIPLGHNKRYRTTTSLKATSSRNFLGTISFGIGFLGLLRNGSWTLGCSFTFCSSKGFLHLSELVLGDLGKLLGEWGAANDGADTILSFLCIASAFSASSCETSHMKMRKIIKPPLHI